MVEKRLLFEVKGKNHQGRDNFRHFFQLKYRGLVYIGQ
jgi:hypothetical protein